MKQIDVSTKLPTYVPMVNVTRITVKHTLGRLPVATLDNPTCSCGMARRIGYTGHSASDLAIYRLKVHMETQDGVTTLPIMFVVDDGKFVEYEQWRQDSCHNETLGSI